MRPDPTDCTGYQICVHGVWVTQNCPDGLYWNAQFGICDWPSNVRCAIPESASTAAPEAEASIPDAPSSAAPSTAAPSTPAPAPSSEAPAPVVTATPAPSQPGTAVTSAPASSSGKMFHIK